MHKACRRYEFYAISYIITQNYMDNYMVIICSYFQHEFPLIGH